MVARRKKGRLQQLARRPGSPRHRRRDLRNQRRWQRAEQADRPRQYISGVVAAGGKIAFYRSGAIWVMDTDGSGQRN